MLYPQEDPVIWAKRYNINITPVPCDCCGKLLPYTIPIAFKDWRGLLSDPTAHACDKKYNHTIVVSVDKEHNKQLLEAIKTFTDSDDDSIILS
jgi:hypothetical protein